MRRGEGGGGEGDEKATEATEAKETKTKKMIVRMRTEEEGGRREQKRSKGEADG